MNYFLGLRRKIAVIKCRHYPAPSLKLILLGFVLQCSMPVLSTIYKLCKNFPDLAGKTQDCLLWDPDETFGY